MASQLEQVQAAGVDLDARDSSGRTAIAIAARTGRASAMKRLLALNASTYVYDTEGTSPLMLASTAGHLQAVKVLLGCRVLLLLACWALYLEC
jgi:uncharacterized protein